MTVRGTTSIGFSNKLVNFFIFFEAEVSNEVDAFLFLTAARSAAFVFLASDAEGRTGLGVGAGGAEKIGTFTSGTIDAVALIASVSSGAPLMDALAISSAAGM